MYVCCSSRRRLGRSIKRENFFYFHAAKINEFLLRNNRGFLRKTFPGQTQLYQSVDQTILRNGKNRQ